MIETKIRKVGNSAVMTLTTEMLTILYAKEGDTLHVVRTEAWWVQAYGGRIQSQGGARGG
ncbi:hypothetical protein [Pseudotabrizicola sp.]|uniref:hypothetical protein n=1 Tax=Pseudotabrizicola sp. TaxID=2939647 RepID=UPI002726B672|nr:hypothetical protein [Pseudotabrizicola sp.]MDO8882561.1 hypothetical protein [Pseudotabrizicola sp.]